MVDQPLPLYPDEKQMAVAIMGAKRAQSWPSVAKVLEQKHGLPPIDPLMGGRFWPAVVAFFNARHSIGSSTLAENTSGRIRTVPFKPDGKESFDQ